MTTNQLDHKSGQDLVARFTAALFQVKEFPAGEFSNRLFNKLRLSSYVDIIKSEINPAPSFGADTESKNLHGIDVASILDAMAAQSIGKAIAALDPSTDPYNFRGCVDQTKAKGWLEHSVIRVAPFLLAEHINSELLKADKSLPSIQDLSKNSTFVAQYHEKLKDNKFISGTILTQVVSKNHHYSTNLLFMLAYFESKLNLGSMVATSDIWSGKVGDVGARWIEVLIEELKHEVEPVTDHLTQSLGPVFAYMYSDRMSVYDKAKQQSSLFVNNTSVTKITTNHPSSAALQKVQNRLKTLGTGATLSWNAIQDHLWEGLKALSSKIQDAVQSHANHESSSDKSITGFGWTGVATTVVRGEKIANLIDNGRKLYPEYYIKAAPSHQSSHETPTSNWEENRAGWNCLVAGTTITTKTGSQNVESLEDGDEIVTKGSIQNHQRPVEYGTVSSEARKLAVQKPKVFGINNSGCFFTASHVFHTTTGLRAIDHITASRANPTTSIGEMRVGHVLFRLGQDMEYELVTIETIESQIMDNVEVVYDVHLAEGRSYHANGYLTSVSYPEVSPKQVASALSSLPPQDRLRMLYKFPELQNLLSQYNATTLMASLTLFGNRRTNFGGK